MKTTRLKRGYRIHLTDLEHYLLIHLVSEAQTGHECALAGEYAADWLEPNQRRAADRIFKKMGVVDDDRR